MAYQLPQIGNIWAWFIMFLNKAFYLNRIDLPGEIEILEDSGESVKIYQSLLICSIS